MKKNLEQEPKFLLWKKKLITSGCKIKNISPLSIVHSRNGELLFAFLDADILTPDGAHLPRYALIRGNACVAVVMVRNKVTKEEKFLMIRQWRSGSANYALEFPAGMVDRNIDNPSLVAQKEVYEETGLKLAPSSLIRLNDKPLFTSAGLLDEAIIYYGSIVEVEDADFRAFEGRNAGSAQEGESIRVTLQDRNSALVESDSIQVHLGFYLFETKFGASSLCK